MKPLYAILLVFGAALAGGLAYQLTRPQPIKVAFTAPRSQPITAPQPARPAPAPAAPPIAAHRKPSPMPPTDTFASAPPAIYQEPPPVPSRPQIAPRRPNVQPPAAQMAPVRTATAKPLQWMPVPYQRPANSPEPKPQPKLEAKVEPPPLPTPPSVADVSRPEPRHVTLTTGMVIAVRLAEPLSAERATAGDHFRGALVEPLVAGGLGNRRAGRASHRSCRRDPEAKLDEPQVASGARTILRLDIRWPGG